MSDAFDLRYHGYAALVCHLNDELAIRTAGHHTPELVQGRFRERVAEYREELARICRDYHRANQTNQRPLAPYLYNPCLHFAFGYTDYLNLMLIDGFDSFFRLTTSLDLPVNQITLAYCPTLESLGVPGRAAELLGRPDSEQAEYAWLIRAATRRLPETGGESGELRVNSPFVELHELLAEPLPDSASSHAFQSDLPLALFSRLKLGGLATLGNGMLLRRAVFRAIAAKVLETQFSLLHTLRCGTVQERQVLAKLQIDEASVRALRVALLDAQGPEEIALYFACRNFSVATSMLAAVGAMLHEDILDAEVGGSHLRQFVCASGTHRRVLQALRGAQAPAPQTTGGNGNGPRKLPAKEKVAAKELATKLPDSEPPEVVPPEIVPPEAGRTLDRNHVFSSKYSVSAVSMEVAEAPGRHAERVGGLLEVYCRANLVAGHLADTEARLRAALARESPVVRLPWEALNRYLVGRYDYDFAMAWRENQQVELIRTTDFLEVLNRIRVSFSDSLETLAETGLLDIASGFVVPLPVLATCRPLIPPVDPRHQPVMAALEYLTERLFAAQGPLSAERLREALKRLHLPIRLERTIQHLMKNFRASLIDPLLFDSVMDMYDVLRALQALITEDLSRHQQRLQDLDFEDEQRGLFRELLFREQMISNTRRFVDAASNAHSFRIRREGRFELHDWAVDVRGGLTQMVHGASVPMQCGLQLLRWCWRTRFAQPRTDRPERERPVGAITRLTLYRSPKFRHIRVVEDQRTVLGVFDFSVGHIFDPTEFIEYFEAAGHLILHNWDEEEPPLVEQRDPWSGAPVFPELTDEQQRTRYELFARLLTQLFVFGVDWKLGVKHSVISWSLRPAAAGKNSKELTEKFLRLAMQSFLVAGLFRERERQPGRKLTGDPSRWPLVHPWWEEARGSDRWADLRQPPRFKEFRDFLFEIGPFCCHFEQVRQAAIGSAGWRANKKLMESYWQAYQQWMPLFGDVWWRAVRLYRGYSNSHPLWRRGRKFDRERVRSSIRRCLDRGQAVLWGEFLAGGVLDQPDYQQLEDVPGLVLFLLDAYADAECERIDPQERQIHRRRDEQGNIDFRRGPSEQRWAPYQVDRRYPRPFCSDPLERERRFRRDIALHRILWDFSTRLRAATLAEMNDEAARETSPERLRRRVQFTAGSTEMVLRNFGLEPSLDPATAEPQPPHRPTRPR